MFNSSKVLFLLLLLIIIVIIVVVVGVIVIIVIPANRSPPSFHRLIPLRDEISVILRIISGDASSQVR